jgi:hypothetical protein
VKPSQEKRAAGKKKSKKERPSKQLLINRKDKTGLQRGTHLQPIVRGPPGPSNWRQSHSCRLSIPEQKRHTPRI